MLGAHDEDKAGLTLFIFHAQLKIPEGVNAGRSTATKLREQDRCPASVGLHHRSPGRASGILPLVDTRSETQDMQPKCPILESKLE